MSECANWSITDVQNAILDNADFEEVGSVAKAKLFATAARRWLILRPQSASHQGNSLTLNAQYVNEMLARAQAYITANSNNSGTTFLGVDYTGFRG
jgi:hypothetical protein